MLAKYDFVRSHLSVRRGPEVVHPPLPANAAAEARMKNALIEQDHVTGLSRDDMARQRRISQARRADSADCLPEMRVMRTGDHAESTAVGTHRFEVREKPNAPERQIGIRVPWCLAVVPGALGPRWQHGATEHGGRHGLGTIQQRPD